MEEFCMYNTRRRGSSPLCLHFSHVYPVEMVCGAEGMISARPQAPPPKESLAAMDLTTLFTFCLGCWRPAFSDKGETPLCLESNQPSLATFPASELLRLPQLVY